MSTSTLARHVTGPWTLAVAAALAGCGALPAGSPDAPSLDEYLASTRDSVELDGASYDARLGIARFERPLEGGVLHVELAWDELAPIGETPVTVELDPSALDGFAGIAGTDGEMAVLPREEASAHLLDPTNRTLCGSRKLVAEGPVRVDGVLVDGAVVGLGWTASTDGDELARAADSVACPLDHESKECKDHAACTITVSCGIISFEVAGQCWPQWPFGWPCLCDPLYSLYCADASTLEEL